MKNLKTENIREQASHTLNSEIESLNLELDKSAIESTVDEEITTLKKAMGVVIENELKRDKTAQAKS